MTIRTIKIARIALSGIASTFAISTGLIHNVQAQLKPNLGVPNVRIRSIGAPNIGTQENPNDAKTQEYSPSISARQKACMRRLSNDLKQLTGNEKEKIKPQENKILLARACTIKVTKGLQIKAARDFIKANFGQDPGSPVNIIPGASTSAPSLILFGDKALASSSLPRSHQKAGRSFYVVTGSTPAHLDIYAGGNSAPYHIGLGPRMTKTLAKMGKKGSFKVVGITGNPVAPTLLLKDSNGRKFGFSYSNSKIYPASDLTKFNYPKPSRITELEARLNWAALDDSKS